MVPRNHRGTAIVGIERLSAASLQMVLGARGHSGPHGNRRTCDKGGQRNEAEVWQHIRAAVKGHIRGGREE